MRMTLVRVALAVLCLLVAACAPLKPSGGGPQDAEPTTLDGPLPPELRALQEQGLALGGERVVFEGVLDFPPRLAGRPVDSPVRLAVQAGPQPAMLEARQSMRALALADPRVRTALGERFSLLRSGWLDDDDDKKAEPLAATRRYQLLFYNYARNETVTVVASPRGEVQDVQARPARVQPAESREEVDAAVAIVRRDERFGKLVGDLRGRGILTESPGNDRHLYLLFYREPGTPAVAEATVNMSTGQVVSARALR
jgi:hypothetical protein